MNTKKRTIIGILAMIIVLAVSAGCLFGCGSGKGSPEGVAKAYIEATKACDAKKIVNLMPKEIVEMAAEEKYDGDKTKMIEAMQDDLDETKKRAEEKDIDMSKLQYEILGIEDADEDDIEKLNESLKNEGLDVKIKDAKTVEIELSYPSEDGGEDKTQTTKLGVVKIGSSWYILAASFSGATF